jgi:serpin B
MPYTTKGGKSLSMLVILPKGESLGSAEASLAGSGLSDLKSKLTSQRVMVYFPKFRLETQYGLSENLQAMGMPVAFSGGADFSGMDGTRDLAISDVVHKAYIDVNEEGTEAAAATGAVMTLSMGLDSNPVPVFNADHPFIFFIMDNDTGNILFMGRVMNPNS